MQKSHDRSILKKVNFLANLDDLRIFYWTTNLNRTYNNQKGISEDFLSRVYKKKLDYIK